MMQRVPTWTRGLVLLLSLALLVSGLAGAGISLSQGRPLWFLLAFESLVVVSAMFGVMAARGRFAEAPALAILCVTGTIVAASLFGYLGAGRLVSIVNMKYWLLGRCAAAAVLVMLAGWTVLSRQPRASMPLLIRGAAFGAVFLASVAAGWWFRSSIGAMPGSGKTLVAVVGGVWLLSMLAPATHYLIRAFEQGLLPDDMDAGRVEQVPGQGTPSVHK
jgi:hypothetical protein